MTLNCLVCTYLQTSGSFAFTLAGIVAEAKGWVLKGDPFQCLKESWRLNQEAWFALGDRDMATQVFRTNLLKKGHKISAVTVEVARALGLDMPILPMTEAFEARIVTRVGSLHFQEYLDKRGAKDQGAWRSFLVLMLRSQMWVCWRRNLAGVLREGLYAKMFQIVILEM